MSEAAEYYREQTKIINILTDIDRADNVTKKQWVKRLIEVSRPIVEEKENLANYINSKLIEYNIYYPRTGEYFYSLFEDGEKREYGTNSISNTVRIHTHDFKKTKDPRLKECECGQIIFENMAYDIKPPEAVEEEQRRDLQIQDTFDPKISPTTDYLSRVADNCSRLKAIAEDLMYKYNDSGDVRDAFKKTMRDPEKRILQQKDIQAKLEYIKKRIDFRNRIGIFEKLKAIILVDTTYLPAKVAKMLYITPKHVTTHIYPKKEEYIREMEWFKEIQLKCPKCKAMNKYSIGDWVNEQMIRKKLGLTLIQPFS